MVEPLKETNGSSRGAKAPVVKGIAVSKFLDLDIQWSAIEDNSGPGDGQTVQKNKNPLNLGGVNLDDFFVQGRGDLSKVVPPESKPLEDDDFKDPRSLSLFDDVKSPGVVGSQQHDNVGLFDKKDAHKSVSSEEHENLSLFAVRDAQKSVSLAEQGFDDKIVASSSDWNSDFQAADHYLSQEKVAVDLAAHMDSVFGSGKELLYAKPADSSTVSKADDWFRDDLFCNVSGEAPNNDSAVHDKNEVQVVGGNGSSSMDIDSIGDDLWQASEKNSIEKNPTDVNDDDDDWNDFASSTNSKTPNNPISQTMESSQDEIFDGQAQVKNDVKEPSVDERQYTCTSVMTDIGKSREDVFIFGNWDSQPFRRHLCSHLPIMGISLVKKGPEMNLFGTNNNHRDLDFDSVSRSGFFSASIGGKTKSEEHKAMPSETSTLERTSDPDGTTTIAPKLKADVAAELMSQMHDLSFMLETKLSVPPISKTE